jgi:hypothetical protein
MRRGTTVAISKADAVRRGARGIAILESNLRPDSLAWLRAGKPAYPVSMGIRLHVYPDVGIVINDGRHRIYLARERGETEVKGKICGYGPRGGELWSYSGRFPI